MRMHMLLWRQRAGLQTEGSGGRLFCLRAAPPLPAPANRPAGKGGCGAVGGMVTCCYLLAPSFLAA